MTRKKLLSLVGFALLMSSSLPLLSVEQEMVKPSASPSKQSDVLLNQASWTDEERRQWYHTSAGTQLLPFDWFMALNHEPFKNNLGRVGILSDPLDESGLSVGLAKTEGPDLPTPQIGLTCSFCHTSQFTYQGKRFRIDGGPSLQYNAKFVHILMEALVELIDPAKFQQFAASVFQATKQQPTAENLTALKTRVEGFTQRLLDRAGRDASPLLWGPGRFDALGRGGNLIFFQLNPDNLRPANAPVSIPALWGAWEYDRVQWGGSIRHPLARNIAQVIGVNANMFTSLVPPFDPQVDQTDPFRSSVDVPKLKFLEDLAQKLHPPRWPKEFPAIDRSQATRGKELYHGDKKKGIPNLCAHCHVPTAIPERVGKDSRLNVTMIPYKEVGTDSLYLQNFSTRTLDAGDFRRGQRLTAKDASKLITDGIMKRAGVMNDPEYSGLRNEWSDAAEFIARPHVAVWATAPYLHNGSVPNLYELLSPVKERHTCFYLSSNMEFDPQKVGFVIGECNGNPTFRDPLGGFEVKAQVPGNGNRGHEFRNSPKCAMTGKEDGVLGCEISMHDRLAIIEYLKTCDLDQVVLKDLPPCHDLKEPESIQHSGR